MGKLRYDFGMYNINLAFASCERLPLAENSVDLIFTDPPYLKEYLPCYDWLAQESMRVLKPGGFVFAMCGGTNLPAIYRFFENSGLTYYWEMQYLIVSGTATYVFPKNLLVRGKVILAYSKGPSGPRAGGVMSYYTGTKDKAWHHWGQDVDSARYYIDYFSAPGEVVLDPFVGGGTTLAACNLIGRRGVGFDIDPKALKTCYGRLSSTDMMHSLPLFGQTKDLAY